jgi:hypothetical protein
MFKRFGILAAVALTCALAACTDPTAPAATSPAAHVGAPQMSGSGVMMGGDT